MAIQIRKKEAAPAEAQPLVKEAEVVEGGAPDVDVKVPEMNDKFLMASGNILQRIVEHRRMITLWIVIIVVVCLGVIGYFRILESGRVSRSSELIDVFATLEAPTEEQANAIEAQRRAELAKAGISADSDKILEVKCRVPNDKARYARIEKHMKTLLPTLAGSEIEAAAAILQAGAATKSGDYDEARKAFQIADKGTMDLRLFALMGEAEVAVQSKNYDEALKKYVEIGNLNPSFKSYARLSEAKLYEVMGQTDKAIDAYVSVIRDYGFEQDHKYAETRLALLTTDWQSRVAPSLPEPSAASAPAPAFQPEL